jgi:hypothetical protein
MPGIGDAALGISDRVLHFVYNAIAYAGIAYVYIRVVRDRRDGFRRRRPSRGFDPSHRSASPESH